MDTLELRDGCELSYGGWILNPSPLLLTTEPSIQPQIFVLKSVILILNVLSPREEAPVRKQELV